MTFIDRLGYIPMGSRIYQSSRPQLPLFAAMVKSYVDTTGNISFAIEASDFIEQEFNYWITNHVISVNGYNLYIYGDQSTGPRPESYSEDVALAKNFTTSEEQENNFFSELKASSESGSDSSSRWYIKESTNEGDITDLNIRSIIPVDLNAVLYWDAKIIAQFSLNNGDTVKSDQYESIAQDILDAIEAVLWNEDAGVWLDYDLINNIPRNYFTPTNLAPLWTMAFDVQKKTQISQSVLNYLTEENIESYVGGIPITKYQSGLSWDYPVVWPPLQYMVIKGLINLNESDTTGLAQRLTNTYIYSNYKAFYDDEVMFDKVHLLFYIV